MGFDWQASRRPRLRSRSVRPGASVQSVFHAARDEFEPAIAAAPDPAVVGETEAGPQGAAQQRVLVGGKGEGFAHSNWIR